VTTRPRLKLGRHLLPGLVAVALFVVLAFTFLTAPFGKPAGFPGEGSITASIGYALFSIKKGAYPSEGFLAAFEIVDFALVAALVAAVMLAKTGGDGRITGALRFQTGNHEDESTTRTDGGRDHTRSEDNH
jgi:NADH-quinone oxidoreductase subunit J